MKTRGLTYSDGVNHCSADRFLSKAELREKFPDSEFVSLSIQYQKRYFCKKGEEPEGSGKKGKKKKKKKKGYGTPSREKAKFKRKLINL